MVKSWSKKNRAVFSSGLLVWFLFMLCSCNASIQDKETMNYLDRNPEATALTQTVPEVTAPESTLPITQTVPASATTKEEPIKATEQVKRVTLLAVGDDLIHIPVIQSGKQEDGSYNFDHLFAGIQSDVGAADIAVMNQETVFAGTNISYSGYPRFNSPQQIGDALVKVGFDVVLHATNHAMDKGEKGLQNTIDYWKKQKNITVLGINETREEESEIKVVEKNGIKIAMLNYTYSLNGLRLPQNRPYMVNMLEEEQMKIDIAKAKQISDFVIVYPHWGTEYAYEPSKSQVKWSQFFADQGVDLIIGTHPHVLEPVEWVESQSGHKTLVYYSLGNFTSYQRKTPRMLGGMAKVTLEKKGDKAVTIAEASITPLVTHYTKNPKGTYTTYKLKNYSEALAKQHGLAKTDGLSFDKLNNLAKKILGEWYE